MIGIIGSGRVGSALGKALCKKEEAVLFYDIVESQLDSLKKESYNTTAQWDYFIDTVGTVAICVPTESLPDGSCDLSIITDVVEKLSDGWQRKWPNGLVLQVSTCPPTTARHLQEAFQPSVEYVVTPSLYNMSRMEWDALHPVKILAGTKDGSPSLRVQKIFGKFSCPIYFANYETIEITKYAHNCLSATLISFWNEIYLTATRLEVDSDWIAKIVATDPMFHSVYRFHKKAYGGPCLEKDTQALIKWADYLNPLNPLQIISSVHKVNQFMKSTFGINEKPLMPPKKVDDE